jgi:spore coat polysaccharide biosynthesis protein SpsF
MKVVNGQPLINWQIQRIQKAKKISRLIVATSRLPSDDSLVECLTSQGVEVYRGSIDDVYSRYFEIVRNVGAPSFIRLTADCPLFMPDICDLIVGEFEISHFDYLSNTMKPTFPNGCDVEVVRSTAMLKLAESRLSREELEHVTMGIYTRSSDFFCGNFYNPSGNDDSRLRWTIDTARDLEFIESVYEHFVGREALFGYDEVMALIEGNLVSPNLEEDRC